MATNTTNSGFLGGDQSPEKLRSEFIDKPLEAAKQTLLGTGLDLFNLISVLPDAFIASEQRELARLKETGKDNDERVNNLAASIEQATALRTTITRGETRVQRALGSLGDSQIAFHGFVSDADLNPVAGLTVRLSGGSEAQSGKRGLSATTEDDGYFRIPLGSKRDSGKEWRTRVGEINFAEKIDSLKQEPGTIVGASTDASSTSKVTGSVEIFQGDKSLYTDPVRVPIDEGSVYREYIVQADPRPKYDYGDVGGVVAEDVASTVSEKAPTKKRTSKK